MPKVNLKIIFLFVVVAALSGALGFSLRNFFGRGLIPTLPEDLFLLFLIPLLTSFLTVFSLVAPRFWRWGAYAFVSLVFTFPLLFVPSKTLSGVEGSTFILSNFGPFLSIIPLLFLGGMLLGDQQAHRSVRTFAIFSARIFSSAYSRLFLSLVLILGALVYFSTALAGGVEVTKPLEPLVRPIVSQVVSSLTAPVAEQARAQLGRDLTEEEFSALIRASGILDSLAGFGLPLKEEEMRSPKALADGVNRAVLESANRELTKLLGPFLVFLPLLLAAGTALTFFFFTPLFVLLSTLAFALVYRLLALLRIVQFVVEERKVPVLKLA